MSTLIIADTREGLLQEVAYELVTAALELEEPVVVAVLGGSPEAVAAAAIEGVAEVIDVTVAGDGSPANLSPDLIVELVRGAEATTILLPFGADAISAGPAAALRLEYGFASDVFALRRDAGLVATRELYAGRVHAEVDFEGHEGALLLLRPGAWAPTRDRGAAPVRPIEVTVASSPVRSVGTIPPPTGDIDITAAEFLLAIGRGIGDQADAVEEFERLATKLGATLVASRPLVDAGLMPAYRQVGQSGLTVEPAVYLAFGISGAVQHLAGMRKAGTIIAVNSDPDAAIFRVAHYGAVADLFDVADELEAMG